MQVRLKDGLIVVTADTDAERAALEPWAVAADGRVFALTHQDDRTFRLTDLGPRPEATREPINVTSRLGRPRDPPDLELRVLAVLPRRMPLRQRRRVLAGLEVPRRGQAPRGRRAARRPSPRRRERADPADVIEYRGECVRVGTVDHWRLMRRACQAKFAQVDDARLALLGTGTRPLTHKTPRIAEPSPASSWPTSG